MDLAQQVVGVLDIAIENARGHFRPSDWLVHVVDIGEVGVGAGVTQVGRVEYFDLNNFAKRLILRPDFPASQNVIQGHVLEQQQKLRVVSVLKGTEDAAVLVFRWALIK